MSGLTPDCSKCPPNGYKFPLPDNIETMEIIQKYYPYLFEGMGNPSISSILLVLKHEGYENREDLFEKIRIYLKESMIVTNKALKRK